MENTMELTKRQQAMEIHDRIVVHAVAAVQSILDLSRELKTMRDTALYLELGFADFDSYVEKKVGMKSRQAYYYISTYEKLGPELIEANASLGISKLKLLAELSPLDRGEFMESNALEDMTTKQVKAAVEAVYGQREQLAFGQEKRMELQLEELEEPIQPPQEDNSELLERLRKAEEAAAGREAELEELERLREEAAARRPEEEIKAELEELRKEMEKQAAAEKREAVARAKEKAEKALAEQVAAAKQQGEAAAREAAQAEAQRQLEESRKKQEEAEARAEELAKKLNLASSKETVKFALHFEQFTANYHTMLEQTDTLEEKGETEEARKLRDALDRAMGTMKAGIYE